MPGQRHIESLSMIPLGTAGLLSWGSSPKIIEGSLEAKFPTIWTDGKAEVGRVREEKRREEERRSEMQVREKSRQVALHCVFQRFVAPDGRKGSLKRRCGAIWRDGGWSVECEVESVKCGVESVEFKV